MIELQEHHVSQPVETRAEDHSVDQLKNNLWTRIKTTMWPRLKATLWPRLKHQAVDQPVVHEDQPEDQDAKKKKLLLDTINNLIELRHTWKNGDPGEIKRSNSPDNKWKVRKAWFTIVGMRFEFLHMLASMGVINFADELKERIQYLLKIIQSYGFSQRLTAESEVDWVDQTIDEVVTVLRGQFEKEFADMLAERVSTENHIPANATAINDNGIEDRIAA